MVEFQIEFFSLLDQQDSFIPELMNFLCAHFLILIDPVAVCVVKYKNAHLSYSPLVEEAESRH